MLLTLNLKGKDVMDLSRTTLKKRVGNLYVSNEDVITEIKDKHITADKVRLYKLGDGNILRKERGRIETQGFYTKANEDELEYNILSIANSLEFSSNFNSYINIDEFVSGAVFMNQVHDVLRTALKTPTQVLDITFLMPSFYTTLNKMQVVGILESFGFGVSMEAVDTTYVTSYLRKYKPSVYALKLHKSSSLDLALKQLILLVSALGSTTLGTYINNDIKNKFVKLSSGWIEENPNKDLILDRLLGKTNLLIEAKKELEAKEVIEDVPVTKVAKKGYGDADGTSLHKVVMDEVIDRMPLESNINIVDYGCNDGKFAIALAKEVHSHRFENVRIIGIDSSTKAIEKAYRNADKARRNSKDLETPNFIQGSLLYTDSRVARADIALLMEVIEHNNITDVERMLDNVFMQDPHYTIITTPNKSYNPIMFGDSPTKTGLRHWDHRFEFTKEEFVEFFEDYLDLELYSYEIFEMGREECGMKPTLGIVITKREWVKPIGFNSDYNEKKKEDLAWQNYNRKLALYEAYTKDTEAYVAKQQKDFQSAAKKQEDWKAMMNKRLEKRKELENKSKDIDIFLIGDAMELINKEDLAGNICEEANTEVEPTFIQHIPEKPSEVFKVDITIGQAGCAFRPRIRNIKEKYTKREETSDVQN